MLSGYVCTLPQRAGIVPLMADRRFENHEAPPMNQQTRPQIRAWTGPDQLLLELCFRAEQRNHLPRLHKHLSGPAETRAWKTSQQKLQNTMMMQKQNKACFIPVGLGLSWIPARNVSLSAPLPVDERGSRSRRATNKSGAIPAL